MRDYILLYINGERHQIRGEKAFLTLSDYLRYELNQIGTKIVCSEGDCGACSVLMAHQQNDYSYKSINSCIAFIYSLDCTSLVTVEGLALEKNLHPIQEAFIQSQASQCGFCTPGFICSMTATLDERIEQKKSITQKSIANGLSGNLCRCTGYAPILEAGMSVKFEHYPLLKTRYNSLEMLNDFNLHAKKGIQIQDHKRTVYIPTNVQEATTLKAQIPQLKILSATTDLGVQYNKNKTKLDQILSLNSIEELYDIKENLDHYFVGAKVSFTKIEHYFKNKIEEFSRLIHVFASPQIKNTASLVGNIANASPIADSVPFLYISNAKVVIVNQHNTREVLVKEFYRGYKILDLNPDEIIIGVKIPKIQKEEKIKLYKISNRKDLDISVVTFGGKISYQETIDDIDLAFGGVGPTVISCTKTKSFLKGKKFAHQTFKDAQKILIQEITPISDVRGSKDYRTTLAKNLLEKFYYDLCEVPHV